MSSLYSLLVILLVYVCMWLSVYTQLCMGTLTHVGAYGGQRLTLGCLPLSVPALTFITLVQDVYKSERPCQGGYLREADEKEEKQERKEEALWSKRQEEGQTSTTLSFETRSLTEPELVVFLSLVSLQTFTILLPPLSGTGVTGVPRHIQMFMWMPRIWTQALGSSPSESSPCSPNVFS